MDSCTASRGCMLLSACAAAPRAAPDDYYGMMHGKSMPVRGKPWNELMEVSRS